MNQHSPDQLWKAVLESRFREAILFFKPDLHAEIDWRIAPEFLDKELQSIFPEGSENDRRADKLVKVCLKTGKELWILVHIEVQGYFDRRFAERMFIYNIRIRERYGHRIFALAVLTDSNPNWHPTEYREAFFDTEIVYRFSTYKVLDHPPETLLHPENPFSIAIETAYEVAKTYRLSDQTKLRAGINLIKKMLGRGFGKQEIRQFLSFIQLHFHFKNPEFKHTFEAEINELIKSEPVMTLDDIYEEMVLEMGIEKGREKGREEGREEGRDLSIRQLLLNGMEAYMISNVLDVPLKRVQAIESALRESGELTD